MPRFSQKSLQNLNECHPDLRRLFNEVIKHWDCAVTDGSRTVEEQTRNVANGVSKTMKSLHLVQPDGFSHAADVAPWPIEWDNPQYERECLFFGGFVMGVASQLGISIRYGGDWDSDHDLNDQTFNDLVHFELRRD